MSENRCNDSQGDSERDESTEEQLQCQKQCICTPYGTLSLASISPWPCLYNESMPETTEMNHTLMHYTKSVSPSATVATIESRASFMGYPPQWLPSTRP